MGKKNYVHVPKDEYEELIECKFTYQHVTQIHYKRTRGQYQIARMQTEHNRYADNRNFERIHGERKAFR